MRVLLILAVLAGVVGCSRTARAPEPMAWPDSDWATTTPEAAGLDPKALQAFDAELAAGKQGYVTGMLVIVNGRIAFERSYSHDFDALFEGRDPVRGPYNYYDPVWHPYYQHGPLHTMQSVSKSVTSALVGIALGRHELTGVDATVLPYFDGFRRSDDARWRAMRLEHLLTMTAGIAWDESTVAYTDPANSCAGMEKSDDWVQFVLDQPMAAAPGVTFRYNSGATELLSHVIFQTTGRHADAYAEEHLFKPTGISQYYWKHTPTGLADTEGGLYLRARDLARIGQLYLNDGVWNGRRILPEGWVAKSVSPLVETGIGKERTRKYGYQWWLLPHGDAPHPSLAYAALGYGGQRLIVVPERKLVAVFTGWNIYEHAELAPLTALDRVLAAVHH